MPKNGRGGRRGAGEAEAILTAGCGCAAGGEDDLEEDMPMCRYTNPIFPAAEDMDWPCGEGSIVAELAAIREALCTQNQLLSELTCAVSTLTSLALSREK